MAIERRIPLERIRTDGWFERLGESIGSFHTLCDVLGEHFFAFALIAGARVNSLMIDRFNPDQSLVEFTFGGIDDEAGDEPTQRLTVLEFRERLVGALAKPEPSGPPVEELGDDMDALQRHIGPRALLLAPLYGYGLRELVVRDAVAELVIERSGQTIHFDVTAFRERLVEHVQEDMERGVQREGGTAIDLNNVDAAERAAEGGDWDTVVRLLGSWPMPLAIYWRTPEGQMLPDAARQRIAEGLGLLGTACAKLGDNGQGEEVLRLAVQYAQDGKAASGIFTRLGEMFIEAERFGEAIGPLRRANALGAPANPVLLLLARAFSERKRWLAVLSCVKQANDAGVEDDLLAPLNDLAKDALGDPLGRWRELVE
jgi:hypothetical protein